MRKVIAIDIGGTFIKYGVVDESGNILKGEKTPTSLENLESFIGCIIEINEKYRKEFEIDGISISVPGFVDIKTGNINACTNIKVIEGCNLKFILEKKFNLPVLVENDANCVALAEKFNGNAKECDDFICLTIGTGIGGGIFLNGGLIRGKEFKGGEFCYMITKEKDGYKTCSQNASMTGLTNIYREYRSLDKNEKVLGEEVFAESEKNQEIKELINGWYSNMAIMIHNIASILNPEKILIGGGISARKEFISEIEEELNKIPYWKYVKCKVEVCKHKNNAGIIGAAYNYFY
ncbi:ROK family protein [Clostridium sp. B9]|uniref:ROK family protein n=1 Tax=Clostridium sp. B9 TaxID=3423224 RepID=UPI003D2EC2FB